LSWLLLENVVEIGVFGYVCCAVNSATRLRPFVVITVMTTTHLLVRFDVPKQQCCHYDTGMGLDDEAFFAVASPNRSHNILMSPMYRNHSTTAALDSLVKRLSHQKRKKQSIQIS
jgi:hypothetical protein